MVVIKRLRAVSVVGCLAFILISVRHVPVQGDSFPTIRFDPPTSYANAGDSLTLKIWVDQVSELNRLEMHVSYEPGTLRIQDTNPGRAGVQISAGDVFDQGSIQWNEAANGEIHFVAQRDFAAGTFTGSGVVTEIEFTVDTFGPATFAFSFDRNATRMSSYNDVMEFTTFGDAHVIIPPLLPTITGRVTREGNNDHARSSGSVVIYPVSSPWTPISWGQSCTSGSGELVLAAHNQTAPPPDILPAGNPPSLPECSARWAFVRLDFPSFLSECYWKCAGGATVNLGRHDLEGGDIDRDGRINLVDIGDIIREYGESVPSPCHIPCNRCSSANPSSFTLSSDLNGDCRVDILDLSQAAGNFDLYSNCPP